MSFSSASSGCHHVGSVSNLDCISQKIIMKIDCVRRVILALLLLMSLGLSSANAETSTLRVHSGLKQIGRGLPTLKPSRISTLTEQLVSVRGGVENTLLNAFAGAAVMVLMQKAVKALFSSQGISFPAPLGACLLLFVSLLLIEAVNPNLADTIFLALSPGAGLLAKWLPVFFVPGLAMLPLAPSVGSSIEILKVIAVVLVGFVYTLTTTTFSVMALRQAQGAIVASSSGSKASVNQLAAGPPPKPFSDQTVDLFWTGSVFFGIASILATRSSIQLATPIRTVFLGFATVAAYTWGSRLPRGFTKVVHPLVTSSVAVLLLIQFVGVLTGSTFLEVLASYKVGTLDPMKTGAGDILLYLLGPSVVSFAISMYSRRTLLKRNFPVVFLAMFVSSVGGLFGTAAFVRAISLGGPDGAMVRLSVLSRNVTTALAMMVTSMLGGDISIAASVVVLTGIIGATYGKSLLTSMGVTDPVCRGLGIGASSQGLGVAAIADEPDAFPFAAISMVLTAMCATTLVSVPAVKKTLIELATGG